jgi:uncharacterized membrane protein YoaK (UPF0700 family)
MAADAQTVPKTVPVLLSVLAGYVDSCTFLALFGLFVAQVTGSFVLAGTQLVAPAHGALIKIAAIPAFLLACVVTTILVDTIGRGERCALAAALTLEAALLAGLFAVWLLAAPLGGPDTAWTILASLCGLSAMGVQSALVRLLVKGSPSTNVMTTNTTQLAIDATELVMAWRAARAAPDDVAIAAEHARAWTRLNGLWPIAFGFLAGTIAGALAFSRFDLWAILGPIALACGLALWAWSSAGRR